MMFKVYSRYYDRTSGMPLGKSNFQEEVDTLQSRVFKGIQSVGTMKDRYENYYNRPSKRMYKNGKLFVLKVQPMKNKKALMKRANRAVGKATYSKKMGKMSGVNNKNMDYWNMRNKIVG